MYSDYFFELGSLYQRASLTINQVLELADEISAEISTSLNLERPIQALNFLRSADSEEESKKAAEDDESVNEPPTETR